MAANVSGKPTLAVTGQSMQSVNSRLQRARSLLNDAKQPNQSPMSLHGCRLSLFCVVKAVRTTGIQEQKIPVLRTACDALTVG